MSHSQLNAMLVESGMEDEVFGALGAALEPLVELAGEVPSPNQELLALFGVRDLDRPRATQLLAFPPRARGSGMAAGALVLALSCVGATGLSAAANTLPTPFQQQVSEFSRRYLPFDFPRPAARVQHPPRPPQAGKDAPSRDWHGRDGAVATEAERTKAVNRSIAQPRCPESPGRPPARTLPRDEPTQAAISALRPSNPEQPAPTASSPSRPTSSSSPQPESRPTGTKSSAGVLVKLVGSGEAPGAVRPGPYGVPGGGKNHFNGTGNKPPRGPVPVPPSASPQADPAAPPVPEPVVGRGPDPQPDPEPANGGERREPSTGGAAPAVVETDSSGPVDG